MPNFHSHKSFLLILATFIGLGLLYDSSTPVFEGLDELWHYAIVQHLAAGEGLPTQIPGQDSPWRQQGNQPPLYYAAVAATTFWIDDTDYWAIRSLRNEGMNIGLPGMGGDKFMFFHTRLEDFPYQGTALAVHIGRWLSLLMAVGTLLLAYLTAHEQFPELPLVAPLTATLVAFNPEFLFVSTNVNNDNLSNLLGAATIFFLARLWRGGFTLRRSLTLGLLCGLAAITKLNGLTIPLAVAVIASMRLIRYWEWRDYITLGIFCVIGVAICAGWWYARNVMLYGDPLAINVMNSYVSKREISLAQVFQEYEGFHFSYWGVFGLVNIMAPKWQYNLYAIFSVLAVGGCIRFTLRNTRTTLLSLSALIVFGFIAWGAALYWTANISGPIARLSFPAVGVFSFLGALGLLALLPAKQQANATTIIAIGMATLALIPPFISMQPEYVSAQRRPPLAKDNRFAIEKSFSVSLENFAELKGYQIVTQAKTIRITYYWHALTRTPHNFIVFTHLLNQNGEFLTGYDSVPQNKNYPTWVWSPEEFIADSYTLTIPPDKRSSHYQIALGLYRADTQERLTPTDPNGKLYTDNLILLPETIAP